MAPSLETTPFPGIFRKYPTQRESYPVTVNSWLQGKRADDGAEGLWRVHDDLYDLTDYVNQHPGGKDWLLYTKGTDVTEAFEVHHIAERAEKILKKFHVRKAKSPRHSLITFDENGFYRTLKRKVQKSGFKLTGPTWQSRLLNDSLVALSILFGTFGACWSLFWVILSGVLLQSAVICSHNFFHMRDNWRMNYFNLSLLSYREWRISHALSHHLFPNTFLDLEITLFEPFLQYLPNPSKSTLTAYTSWIITPLVFVLLTPQQFVVKVIGNLTGKRKFYYDDYVSLLFLLAIWLLSGSTITRSLFVWIQIELIASFIFAVVGLTAAHHHPDIYHEGDYIGENKDFGLFQLAAVRDRVEVNGSFFLVLISFGDHALHHMFPTIDHVRLPELYPYLEETCKEFNIEYRLFHVSDLVVGMYQQLARDRWNNTLAILRQK